MTGESCATWLVTESTTLHTLKDGTPVLVRPLLYSDREELVAGYRRLSEESKRLRFFSAPEHLSEAELEYLTNLDYHNRYALAAFAGDVGIGVARYIREAEDPTRAELAITVADEWQGRGLATILLSRLAEEAVARGVRTFVAHVLWENEQVLEPLAFVGATVVPDEPGVARVEVDLWVDESGSALARLLRRVTSAAPPKKRKTA